jgi:hypothetical protein
MGTRLPLTEIKIDFTYLAHSWHNFVSLTLGAVEPEQEGQP